MWHMIFIDLLALLTLASVYIHGQKEMYLQYQKVSCDIFSQQGFVKLSVWFLPTEAAC